MGPLTSTVEEDHVWQSQKSLIYLGKRLKMRIRMPRGWMSNADMAHAPLGLSKGHSKKSTSKFKPQYLIFE